jgi:hypothetical protein
MLGRHGGLLRHPLRYRGDPREPRVRGQQPDDRETRLGRRLPRLGLGHVPRGQG